jgi:predicted nucleic acid-binding protein
MKLYLDASAIIYSIEGVDSFRELVIARISEAEADPNGMVITSRLSCLECRVKPMRDGNAQLLSTYDSFFARSSLAVIEIGVAIVDRATELRAKYGLKTPDSIHAATAMEEHADLILTGDRDLARCGGIIVQVL